MLLILFSGFVFGQDLPFNIDSDSSHYLVRNFTTENGLPVNSINSIAQDSAGFLFFSTLNGLVRFDGYEFEVFNSGNTRNMASDRITKMTYTQDDRLWLMTEAGFLMAYFQGKIKTYDHSKMISEPIIRQELDLSGNLWVASNQKVYLYNPINDNFTQTISLDTEGTIITIEPISTGDILIMSTLGIYRWHNSTLKLLVSRNNISSLYDGLFDTAYTTQGLFWIMSSKGFFAFDIETGNLLFQADIEGENAFAYSITEIDNGYMASSAGNGFHWVDSELKEMTPVLDHLKIPDYGRRLHYFEGGNDQIFVTDKVIVNGEIIFNGRNTRSAFVDRDGSIWLSSDTDGLFQLRQSIIRNITSGDIPGFRNVYPIVQANDDTVITGTIEDGIFYLTNKSAQHWHTGNSGLPSNFIRSLFYGKNGTLYIGFWTLGLYSYDNGTFTPILINSKRGVTDITVEAIHTSDTGAIFLGTKDSTYVIEQGVVKTLQERIGFHIKGTKVIRESEQGDMYFGTNGNGLMVIREEEKSFVLDEISEPNIDLIRDIFIQSPDTLWVASENRGLSRLVFNTNGKVTSSVTVKKTDGLLSDALHRIIDDNRGTIWVSSNGGIMAFPLKELNEFADGTLPFLRVAGFTEDHGMINREANGGVDMAGMLRSENELWFPNQSGTTILDIDKYYRSSQTSEVTSPIIKSIAISDSLLLVESSNILTLPKGERNANISFTAPNFVSPDRVQFNYKVSGIHDRWQPANTFHEANITNLSAGSYQFDVQTIWENGQVSTSSLNIIIPAFFYETALFRVFIIGMLLFVGFSIYKVRVRHLKRREEELEERVKQQTKELALAAEQKSRFFSGITHELKTPISLIMGPIDDLIEQGSGYSEEKREKYLFMMQRNVHRLKNLTEQILEVTKLNADAIYLQIQPVHIESLTTQIAGQFQSLLDQKKVSLSIESGTITEPIYIDKEAWERIVINLMSNAVKFSQEGSKIIISFRDKQDNVEVRVRDFGTGISKDDQGKIFNYLYQTKNNPQAGGTGIGLFLVKGLLERLGGSIEVKSELNEGTEFVVTLCKGTSHFSESDSISYVGDSTTPISSFPETTALPKTGEAIFENDEIQLPTILLVEDNEDFREYLSSTLKENYQIITARNGKEGLFALEKNNADLIISDIMMPVMGGFEFISQIRAQEKFRTVPVIFLSAKDRETDFRQGLSTGADIYLTKPIKSSSLLAQIEAILRREAILNNPNLLSEEHENEPGLVSEVREIIYRQLANPILNVDMLAEKLYMSRAKLYRNWKLVNDQSISEYIKKLRLEEAKVLLKENKFSITETAHSVGFSDPNYFSTSFKKEFGYSPSELLK
ncbi:MAG: response regulator [Balneolaceae bacterium]|nr:response regulator [Balneolaceae bacterium]MBO6546799.1 response regulator [Balneolaceae bacterium]MBO6649159.1 response regulator [Balneolaceae bacterium]